MTLPIVREVVSVLFAILAAYVGYLYFCQVGDAVRSGRIRVRTFYLVKSRQPKAFRAAVVYVSAFAFACVAVAIFLVGRAFVHLSHDV